jgi:hypothetical protein
MVTVDKKVWDFIEKNYPNYYGCSNITTIDDITKILNNELSESDDNNELVQDLKNQPKEKIQDLYNALMVEVYHNAILNFSKKKK